MLRVEEGRVAIFKIIILLRKKRRRRGVCMEKPAGCDLFKSFAFFHLLFFLDLLNDIDLRQNSVNWAFLSLFLGAVGCV